MPRFVARDQLAQGVVALTQMENGIPGGLVFGHQQQMRFPLRAEFPAPIRQPGMQPIVRKGRRVHPQGVRHHLPQIQHGTDMPGPFQHDRVLLVQLLVPTVVQLSHRLSLTPTVLL